MWKIICKITDWLYGYEKEIYLVCAMISTVSFVIFVILRG